MNSTFSGVSVSRLVPSPMRGISVPATVSVEALTGRNLPADRRRNRRRPAVMSVDDLEATAHVDLELLAVARGDVGLVRSGAVVVRLGAHDRRAGVLGEDGRLDLVLGVAGQRGLARAAAAAAMVAMPPTATTVVRLDGGGV